MNPHTAHSHSKPHTSNPGTPRMSSQNQGGRPMTMVVGMATVAAGLGAFWMLQFRTQNRNPTEIPTWQYRHAQQVAEVNERVSPPGGGDTKTSVRSSDEPHQRMPSMPSDSPETAAKNPKGSSSSLSDHDGPERHGKGILASILTFIHGDPKDTQNDGGHVGQPAPIRRLNDRGGVYTKNSEYKDSNRRE